MKCLMLNHDHQDNGCGHTVLNCLWALMSTGRLQWLPDMTQWFHPILTGLVMLSGWYIKLFPTRHTILESDEGVSRIWASGASILMYLCQKRPRHQIFLGEPWIYPPAQEPWWGGMAIFGLRWCHFSFRLYVIMSCRPPAPASYIATGHCLGNLEQICAISAKQIELLLGFVPCPKSSKESAISPSSHWKLTG